ncbi:hypothetical protein B0H13DRAFT_2306007 [Mycena leptocephala]|nr:hypothetical protein B0H13DRAFT_2306007 [Mycena leptocephala]
MPCSFSDVPRPTPSRGSEELDSSLLDYAPELSESPTRFWDRSESPRGHSPGYVPAEDRETSPSFAGSGDENEVSGAHTPSTCGSTLSIRIRNQSDSPPTSSLFPRIRRTVKKRILSTPPSSPDKKKRPKKELTAVTSTIRTGLERNKEESSPKGLFKFFPNLATEEDKKATRLQWLEGRQETYSEGQGFHQKCDQQKADVLERQRALARSRQQKHRSEAKNGEILRGERSPGGTKRKAVDVILKAPPTKRFKMSVAEATRPNRAAENRMAEKKKLKGYEKRGRKKMKERKEAVYHNWFTPLSWTQIERAATHPSVGRNMSASAIRDVLRRSDPVIFEKISHSTIDGWIDRSGERPKWKESVLVRAEKANFQGHPNGGRRGALVNYPDVVESIMTRLHAIRNGGAPVTLVTVRAIFIATILKQAPEIFDEEYQDKSHFKVSDSYLRKWLRETIGWSVRTPTNAAQKLPINWEDLCEKTFFRIAYTIKEHDIPAALFVNSDQTQVVYSPGTGLTWATRGAKQISVVGVEEKRAFTLVVNLGGDGQLLAFQGVFKGSTGRSRPNTSVRGHPELTALGCKFVSSGTDTYWSNLETQKMLVDHIIAPHFVKMRAKLRLPPTQMAVWLIDLWRVQTSKAFRDWMAENHPFIIIIFVPGGCTGKFQPCDMSINRLLKHSIKRSAHEDMVSEMVAQIEEAEKSKQKNPVISVDRTEGYLRDKSPGWLWDVYQVVNEPEVAKKVCLQLIYDLLRFSEISEAFEGCKAKQWNLSYECLTGFEARQELRDLKATQPEFWVELESGRMRALEKHNSLYDEEFPSDPSDVEDDSEITCQAVKAAVVAGTTTRLTSEGKQSEEIRDDEELIDEPSAETGIAEGGKRKRKQNPRYKNFWRHWDEDDTDDENYT